MNIRKFKNTVSEWDNYKECFRLFRVWIENSYKAFEKSIYLDIVEEKFIGN